MKSNTYITILLALLLPFLSLSQVKVGDNPTTIDGSALLELESTNKGFLSPRMSEVQMNGINSPADGLMVYCTDCSPKGFYYFDGVSWKRILGPKSEVSTNGTAVVSSYGDAACSGGSGTITGSMTVKNAVSGVTMELYADVTQVGTWSITAIQNGVTFTASDTFTTTGCQLVTLTGTGTAVESGEFTWSTNTAPSGNATATVNPDNSSGGAAAVVSYGAMGCSGGEGSISGTMTEGIEVSGVTMELYADVTEVGSWSLEATENGVTFSGSGTFATTGCQAITLTASGTPTAGGSFTWTTNTTPIGSATATVTISPPSLPIGSGTFIGTRCFDIAESNNDINQCGLLSGRSTVRADFNQSSTYNQDYTFTPIGTVSNVRFYYVNTNGNVITGLSGGDSGNNITSPVVATVTYNQDLSSDNPNSPTNGLALGLTNSNPLTADLYVVYNDNANNTGTDQTLKLNAQVKDCRCDCGAYMNNGNYREFLCYNLGANTSIDAHTATIGLNGAYVQWGRRGPTGDSQITWQTSPNTTNFKAAPTSSDANTGSVSGWSQSNAGNTSWRVDTKTGNDPCPSGYRLPTPWEWLEVINNNTVTRTGTFMSGATEYGSALHFGVLEGLTYRVLLTLPAAGSASQNNGSIGDRGSSGYYWTSKWVASVGYGGAYIYDRGGVLRFNSGSVSAAGGQNGGDIGSVSLRRRNGASVRCIKQ